MGVMHIRYFVIFDNCILDSNWIWGQTIVAIFFSDYGLDARSQTIGVQWHNVTRHTTCTANHAEGLRRWATKQQKNWSIIRWKGTLVSNERFCCKQNVIAIRVRYNGRGEDMINPNGINQDGSKQAHFRPEWRYTKVNPRCSDVSSLWYL